MADGHPSITFIACVEPGLHRLDYKAAALFFTMRRNMGAMANAPIWAYSPRPGRTLATWCREILDHFEVHWIDEPLNAANPDYALANKPAALAHAEAHAATEFVTFLDSDILAWSEPSGLLLAKGIDIALVPDGTKTTASAGPGDPYEDYWNRLYELVGATARPFVTTTLTGERLRGTWNSGVIPIRRTAGIAADWQDAMGRLLANDFSPPQAAYLKENNLLSALVAARYERFAELPVAYNYPIQNWEQMTRLNVPPDRSVLWHYQPFFGRLFRRFAERMDRASSLSQRLVLIESLVADLRINFRRRLGLDEGLVRSLRRRARLGPRLRALLGVPKPTDGNLD